jgi:hypothetical protein
LEIAWNPAFLFKARNVFKKEGSNLKAMKKLSCALVLGVFGASCMLGWAMLTLMAEVRNAGRVLPYFTNLCIGFRPVLIALPLLAAAYYVSLWFHKEEKVSRWMVFVAAMMAQLLLLVLPVIATSYLLMSDQVYWFSVKRRLAEKVDALLPAFFVSV